MTHVAILGNPALYHKLVAIPNAATELDATVYASPAALAYAMSVHQIDVILICGTKVSALAFQVRRLFPVAAIVVLLSHSDATKRVKCLEHGADVCLTMPTSMEELVATIASICRRVRGTVGNTDSRWTLWQAHRRLIAPDGYQVVLTAKELTLMQQLADAFPRPVSRRQIVESMGLDYLTFDERRLEAIVSRLRHKLPQWGNTPSPIRHARSLGYFFSNPIERVTAASDPALNQH
jgi:DNA-binding response OmpR family regulator